MKLTDDEKRMLAGEHGPGVRKSMEILTALGDIYDAEKMVRVASVHMPGASITVAGEAGTNFVEEISKSVDRFAVLTTLNPGAIDRKNWAEMGLLEEEFEPQLRLTRAYERMGGISCHTCTPYFIGNIPRQGEHVAWGESSAVVYVNSVMGARTNREGGPSALASAVTGLAPAYGYHLAENRKGHKHFEVKTALAGYFDYGNLGYHVGRIVEDGIPVFTGIPQSVTWDELKTLGSALASSGAVAMFHVVGVTPEAPTLEAAWGGSYDGETQVVGQKELEAAARGLNKAEGKDVDWVFLGCPHLSIQEFARIADLLEGKRLSSNVEMWLASSESVRGMADVMGYSKTIRDAGARIICETCPVLALTDVIVERKGFRSITTDSCKMAHYMPGQFNLLSRYGSLDQCITAAISGRWE